MGFLSCSMCLNLQGKIFHFKQSIQFINAILTNLRYQRTSKDFRLAITNPDTPFDITKSEIAIKPGFIYSLKVMPSQIVTTPGFDEMSIGERNCRLPKESEHLNHFKNYTKAGCTFECAMDFAYEKCFCLPWSFPRTGKEEVEFCDIFGNVLLFRNLPE